MEARIQASVSADTDKAFILAEGGCDCGRGGSVPGSGCTAQQSDQASHDATVGANGEGVDRLIQGPVEDAVAALAAGRARGSDASPVRVEHRRGVQGDQAGRQELHHHFDVVDAQSDVGGHRHQDVAAAAGRAVGDSARSAFVEPFQGAFDIGVDLLWRVVFGVEVQR